MADAIFTNLGNVRGDQFGGMMPISGTDPSAPDATADTSAEGNTSFAPPGIE
ncbi:hypothetical protein [uncultured Thioclava sp.]|uniref:hypothetical protein n=1 Tax=uncultured Thioclava sp. TaxID=473858 RepID=UPI0025D28DCB|nr:hypothetical protein [uncultured Thioclava sp.]